MPVIFTQEVDRSQLTIDIAKSLFKDFDFNEGQQSIIDSASYLANVIQYVEYDIEGQDWTISSEITNYFFEINVSHPEAVDQATSQVLEDTKGYIEELFNQTEYAPKGELLNLSREMNSEYFGVLRKVGLMR